VENAGRGARAGVLRSGRARVVVVPFAVSAAIRCAPSGFPCALARRAKFTRGVEIRARGIRLACARHARKNSLAEP